MCSSDLDRSSPCTPRFSAYGARAYPGAEAARDDKFAVDLDVLAVADLGGDSGLELVLALRYPDVRTIAVFSIDGVGQLTRRAETRGWQ